MPGPNNNDYPPRKRPKIAPVDAEQVTHHSPTRENDAGAPIPNDYPRHGCRMKGRPRASPPGNCATNDPATPHPELDVLPNHSATTPGREVAKGIQWWAPGTPVRVNLIKCDQNPARRLQGTALANVIAASGRDHVTRLWTSHVPAIPANNNTTRTANSQAVDTPRVQQANPDQAE